MPVIQKTVGGADVSRHADLVAVLASELTTPKTFGQPLVMEEEFPRTGRLGVTVVWDRLYSVSDLDRPAIIRNAYEAVHPDKAKRIAFVSGYTVPEGVEAGLLPYAVTPLIRKTDPPNWWDDCLAAMVAVGASTLADPKRPTLRFPTLEQAEVCWSELKARVAGAESVWVVSHDSP